MTNIDIAFYIVFGLMWFLGAALTVKADSALDESPSDYRFMLITSFIWPVIAVLLLCMQHLCVSRKTGKKSMRF